MFRFTVLFLMLCTVIAHGQPGRRRVFIERKTKEYKKHYSPPPLDIEMAMDQVNSNFTDAGRNYFAQLPEKIAVLQFGEVLSYLEFTWKMDKKNPSFYPSEKTRSDLVKYFIVNGATGDHQEILRLIMIALHRKLNNKPFTISELSKIYNNDAFQKLRDSVRDVKPRDTVFCSYFNREKFFHPFSWSTWFEVVSKDNVTDSIKVKIIKIGMGQNQNPVEQVKFGQTTWKIGDVIKLNNRYLRNWKEVIKIYY